MTVKILIADDHELFRDCIATTLALDERIEVIAQVGNSREVLEVVRRQPVDVILLDLKMPGRGGLDTLTEIKRLRPEIRVLVVTAYPEDRYALPSLKAGADGFLTKAHALRELLDAIDVLTDGRRYITDSVAQQLAASLDRAHDAVLHEELSSRELQVLCLMAEGGTLTSIADELSLSVKTVSTYRSRLLSKMGMSSNAELIRYALEQGLVD